MLMDDDREAMPHLRRSTVEGSPHHLRERPVVIAGRALPSRFGITLLALGCCWLSACANAFSTHADMREVKSCDTEDLRVSCEAREMIAVHEAVFTMDGPLLDTACLPLGANRTSCIEDIRKSVNKKCSGLDHCRYNFTSDHSDRRCRGPGTVVVRFVCVPESKTYKSCNLPVLTEPEGYIVTPAFPRYYPKLENCTWSIEGGGGQTVVVTILDIAMRPPTTKRGMTECVDVLTLYEGTNKLLTTCGHSEDGQIILEHIESQGNTMGVRFVSQEFASRRGVMLKYNLKGCPTLSAPRNGYLVYRNGSTALYMCCKDYVFADTGETSRTMHCVDGNRWNTTMRHCILIHEADGSSGSETGGASAELLLPGNWSNDGPVVEESSPQPSGSSYMIDIVIPSILMVVLLFGNILIIFIILRYRRRQKLRESPTTASAETASLKANLAPIVVET